MNILQKKDQFAILNGKYRKMNFLDMISKKKRD